MTETKIRLPEVGKRYKCKESNKEYKVWEICQSLGRNNYVELTIECNAKMVDLVNFWEMFEELPPLSKMETTEKPTGAALIGGEEYLGLRTRSVKDKALEELKEELKEVFKALDAYDYLQSYSSSSEYFSKKIEEKIQNLVNALEEEKKSEEKIIITGEDIHDKTCRLECEIISDESNLGVKKALLRQLERKIDSSKGNNSATSQDATDKNVGRIFTCGHAPIFQDEVNCKYGKCDGNHVGDTNVVDKPKTIWKDVGELPEDEEVIFRTHNNQCYYGYTANDRLYNKGASMDLHSILKFITLTDFINSFESEKQAREQLEERVRILEKKNG